MTDFYGVPTESGHAVWELTREVATAIRRTYGCTGTSIRQHNEPSGNQDVWHLHVHVFPRYDDDLLYQRHREARWVSAEERAPYASLLRDELGMPVGF